MNTINLKTDGNIFKPEVLSSKFNSRNEYDYSGSDLESGSLNISTILA